MLNKSYGQDMEFFDFFRSLEAYAALGGEGRTMVLSPDSDFFRFFRMERRTAAGTDEINRASRPGWTH